MVVTWAPVVCLMYTLSPRTYSHWASGVHSTCAHVTTITYALTTELWLLET